MIEGIKKIDMGLIPLHLNKFISGRIYLVKNKCSEIRLLVFVADDDGVAFAISEQSYIFCTHLSDYEIIEDVTDKIVIKIDRS